MGFLSVFLPFTPTAPEIQCRLSSPSTLTDSPKVALRAPKEAGVGGATIASGTTSFYLTGYGKTA